MAKNLKKLAKENIKRNRGLLKLLNTWDGKLFDNDEIWKAVAVRRNCKKPIKL